MKTDKGELVFIIVLILGFITLGWMLGWALYHNPSEKPPEYLTADYIQYMGFKKQPDGNLVRTMKYPVIITKTDTIVSYIGILPPQDKINQFWTIGYANGKTFIPVQVIRTCEELDIWIRFMDEYESKGRNPSK